MVIAIGLTGKKKVERLLTMNEVSKKLSKDTIERIRKTGLDPDEMSEGQLEALESLENPAKSHWLAKPFTYIGGGLWIIALLALLTGGWGAAIMYVIIGAILMYIGYKIQNRVAGKKFVEASIKKDMEKRGKGEDALWDQFKSLANTDEVLQKKAKELAPALVHVVNMTTDALIKNLKETAKIKIDGPHSNEAFLEILLFYMHWMDRIAFDHLGKEKRGVFMDALFLEVRESISQLQEGGIEATEVRSVITALYAERQNEYAQYKKLFPEKEEGYGGTLFWEFGEKVSSILSQKKGDVLIIGLLVNDLVVRMMGILEIPKLLSNQTH